MTRRVSIFGATGSIGQSTLDLIKRAPDAYDVVALTGHSNISALARDAIAVGADIAVTADETRLGDLRDALAGTGIDAAAGHGAILEAADRPTDWAMSAIIGVAGFEPGLRILRHGGVLALANKESLVAGGPLLMRTAREFGATILPVDSEHSAIFQSLVGEDIDAVERVIITASGGAFRDRPLTDLASVSVAEASKHPNWDMGQRITIDSASMFNKAMEVIETKEFFGFSADEIEVIVHPQSLIHAMIGFVDGGIMAHVGPADMRHAIGYALFWPERGHVPVERLDFAKIATLDFRAPCHDRYPALRIAQHVMETGGHAGAAFNAAKERALDRFIAGDIGFMQMGDIVDGVVTRLSSSNSLKNAEMSLDMIKDIDTQARRIADEIVGS